METIFHSLQFAHAFLRQEWSCKKKAIKICQSHSTIQLSLTLENTKESKKKKCADSEI